MLTSSSGISETELPDADFQSRSSAPAPSERNDSLDGLRAIAVLLVMGVHTGFPLLSFGWLGVDMFFVLSGFLITTLLCEEFRRTERVSVTKFWGRRFLRLMPVYWIYVGGITAAMLLGPSDHLHTVGGWTPGRYILSLWAYFVNLAPLSGIWAHQQLTLHLWSLAVEEQYYFFWPLCCAVILRFRRPWMAGLALIALILFFRRDANPASEGLQVVGIGIVIGSSLALFLRDRPVALLRWIASSWARWAAVALTLLAFVVLGLLRHVREDRLHHSARPWLSLLFAGLIGILWYGPNDKLARILSWPPLRYIGRISYGMYVYHMLAQFLVWQVLLRNIEHWNKWLKYGLRCLLFFGITFGLSIVSYQVIERRFLRIKDRLR